MGSLKAVKAAGSVALLVDGKSYGSGISIPAVFHRSR
jgi:hypothetical protein